MHAAPFTTLACPIDGLPLTKHDKQLRCENNHSFDIARQGYVNLLPSQDKRSKHPGDSKEMIDARQRFLDSGVYAPISDAVNALALKWVAQSPADTFSLLDAGCGEGYYLQRLKEQAIGENTEKTLALMGMDISKPAVLAAARREKSAVCWVVGTNRNIPVLDQSVDMILCMFGFPVFDAFKKAIHPYGKVILVESGPEHLIELREQLYDEVRKAPLPAYEQATELGFTYDTPGGLTYQSVPLDPQQLQALMVMTPHFFKASREKRERIAALQSLSITIDVRFRVFSLS